MGKTAADVFCPDIFPASLKNFPGHRPIINKAEWGFKDYLPWFFKLIVFGVKG
jgi:hypothetical protein